MAKAKHKARRAAAADGSGRSVEFGPLTDYLGYALRRAQMSAVAEFLDAFREVDLRPTQFAVLTIINENPGIRQSEVCTALGIQKANFVPLLNELERRGLALRKAGVSDRRSSALHLTALGDATLQRARALHEAYEEQFVTRLGRRGRDQLLALLNKVMAVG
ncbi:MAG TPA: MarR family transcriptional regulator [Steroidobacteraceae bacterium]|nr:MarR family transcriptional regulator [Steroidobacteraceae bacterium]